MPLEFTYEVNLLCPDYRENVQCAGLVCSMPAQSAEEGRQWAIEQARLEGWATIGSDIVCPRCAERRKKGGK